ncbi:hypothetical protein [Streptomonospora salina]|uniref:Uncharacterized protein n=1 Tax=Streptomonospora salina TaxID=104205 RepID=A0A841EB85_9ACTN|nr:hypothetical protein [Streptomonospora salina]MBB6000246.1 hypothetical protein [Streptomonospora salina]
MPDGLMQIHPVERLVLPDGGEADIDAELVPLMRALWSLGLSTLGCCQDHGEAIGDNGHRSPTSAQDRQRHADFYRGYVWLKMPNDDAKALVAILGEHPAFAHRVRRWTHPEAWMNIVYMFPEDEGGGAELADAAQLHFPRSQLSELVGVLFSADQRESETEQAATHQAP